MEPKNWPGTPQQRVNDFWGLFGELIAEAEQAQKQEEERAFRERQREQAQAEQEMRKKHGWERWADK
jgi:hypothetical protein